MGFFPIVHNFAFVDIKHEIVMMIRVYIPSQCLAIGRNID